MNRIRSLRCWRDLTDSEARLLLEVISHQLPEVPLSGLKVRICHRDITYRIPPFRFGQTKQSLVARGLLKPVAVPSGIRKGMPSRDYFVLELEGK